MTQTLENKHGAKLIKETVFAWVVMTISFGVIYKINVESLRSKADSPQLVVSETVADKLSSGRSLDIFLNERLVDVDNSLSPYVIVFDNQIKLVFSTARIKGKVPSVPSDLIEDSMENGVKTVTWQPENGNKQALVVRHYRGANREGYVASGRSLAETEAKTKKVVNLLMWLWVVSLLVIFIFNVLVGRLTHKKPLV